MYAYTPKQLEVMRVISRLRAKLGMSPTLGEIASELRVSTITVYEHVGALERKGALQKKGDKGAQRSLEVLDPDFLPASDGALYKAALSRLAKLTGGDPALLDAEIRSSLAPIAVAPVPAPSLGAA